MQTNIRLQLLWLGQSLEKRMRTFSHFLTSFFPDYIVIVWLFAMAVLLNIHALASDFIVLDDTWNTFMNGSEVWVQQGRFTNYLIQDFIFTSPVTPFATELMGLFFLSLSYYVMVKTLKWSFNLATFASFPVFIAFPSFYFINEFDANIIPTALGFLFTAISVCCIGVMQENQRPSKMIGLLAIVLFALAIGIYQTFVTVFIALAICLMITQPALNIRPYVWSFVFGLLVYFVLDKTFRFFYSSIGSYTDALWSYKLFLVDPWAYILKLGQIVYSSWFNTDAFYGRSLQALSYFIVLFIIHQFFIRKSVKNVILFLILLQTPFLVFYLSIHVFLIRTYIALPLVAWFTVVFILLNAKKHSLAYIMYGLLSMLLVQILYVNARYEQINIGVDQFNKRTVEQIYNRMLELNPSYDKETLHQIHSLGSISYPVPIPAGNVERMSSSDMLGTSIFNYNHLDPAAIFNNFMHINSVFNTQYLSIKNDDTRLTIYHTMPVWPAKDSVKFIDGVYYIKLSANQDDILPGLSPTPVTIENLAPLKQNAQLVIDVCTKEKYHYAIRGWAGYQKKANESRAFDVLVKQDKAWYELNTRREPRPDVTAHLNGVYQDTQNYDDSGFATKLPIDALGGKPFEVYLRITEGDNEAFVATDCRFD
jgi:hypothetical protein